MGTLRVAYLALVWPRSSVHTKVTAQMAALERMRVAGEIESLVGLECHTDEQGNDWLRIGSSARVKFRRVGRAHSWSNILISYPRVYDTMARELRRRRVNVAYIRKPPVFDPRSVRFMRRLRSDGIRVVLELPTYPYDAELVAGSLHARLDLAARRRLRGAVDLIATPSSDESIFGVPCVTFDNGADVLALPLAATGDAGGIRATVVASLQTWHRVDRIVTMLLDAWLKDDYRIECLNIVGVGPESARLAAMVDAAGFEASRRVRFHGALYGSELSAIFDETDLAFGHLEEEGERGLSEARALKHREYAARGLPFVYGLPDPSFSVSNYALRVGDGPMNLDQIVSWYRSLSISRADIRKDALRFDWESQFRVVFNALGG